MQAIDTYLSSSTANVSGYLQRRLVSHSSSEPVNRVDEHEVRRWSLRDIRALAIDPDVDMRRVAARSDWTIDAELQLVLATDPDEQVVLDLLSRVDPHADAAHSILTGPHPGARRELARRNLPTSTLLTLIGDNDELVRGAARSTLDQRAAATQEP